MADDADFTNGRLRLTAFLRAVENGLPQRPSRFRRKVQIPKTASADPSDMSALEVSRTAGELPGESHGDAIERVETRAEKVGPSQATIDHRSPSPQDLEEGTFPDVTDHTTKTSMDVSTDAENTPHTGVTASAHQSATKRPTGPSNEPLQPHKSQNIHEGRKGRKGQKRRLPVNCLSLSRTTTTDGLPDPYDAWTTFAAPITEVDPIHDTQQTAATREHVLVTQLSKAYAESKPVESCRRLKSSGSSPVKGSTDPDPTPQEAPININLGRNQPLTLYDGFVGAELTVIPLRKTKRRAKNTPRVMKPKFTQKGLQLATGELPTTLLKSDDQYITMDHQNSSVAISAFR